MPSFDIVIETDLQEVDNAINQARKEISQRYDFKGSKSTIEWDKKAEITLLGDDNFKLEALIDALKGKLVRRGISAKNLNMSDPEPAADSMVRQKVSLQVGVPKEVAKAIVKEIKSSKLKVQAQIQEDQVRVTGKKRDDLQAVMQLVKASKQDYEFQFVNFRD
jgi:uncharacterized protein YajQ (UPF0234 family)